MRSSTLILCLAALFAPVSAAASAERAADILRRALNASGGADAIERAGGIALTGEGTWDLGTRMQGMTPGAAEPAPLRERLVIDPVNRRTAYESHGRVNSDAFERIRFVYAGDDLFTVVLLADSVAFRNRDASVPDDRARYERIVPQRLLAEALAQPAALEFIGLREDAGRRLQAVRWTLSDGEALDLTFDAATGRLAGASFMVDMPLRGDTPVRWRFEDYRDIEGLGAFPMRYRIDLGDRPLKDMRWTDVRPGATAGDALFAMPAGTPEPETPPAPAAPAETTPAELPPPDVRALAPGVHLVVSVRSGFHHLVVEFADFTLVVDAPSGWLEFHQLPAKEGTPGATSSSLSERLIGAVQRIAPEKPVRYVALTHAHGDHAGGVRAFVAHGATVLGTEATRPMIERAMAAPHTLHPDRLVRAPRALRYETVRGTHVIEDDSMRVELIEIGANPHAEGMLVVHLPKQRLLYQADLFFPSGVALFPEESRVPVMQFFTRWLEQSGLDPERIYSIHGSARVTSEQLAIIRARGESAGS